MHTLHVWGLQQLPIAASYQHGHGEVEAAELAWCELGKKGRGAEGCALRLQQLPIACFLSTPLR